MRHEVVPQEVDQGVGVLRPLAAQPGLAQRHVEAGPGVPDAAAQPPGVHPLVLRHRHDLPLQRPLHDGMITSAFSLQLSIFSCILFPMIIVAGLIL